jgi:hypothetical protein
MYDPATPFQDQLARRLLRRAAELRERAERLAAMSSVFDDRREDACRRRG